MPQTKMILIIKYEADVPTAKSALDNNNIKYENISYNKFEMDSDYISLIKDLMGQREIEFDITN